MKASPEEVLTTLRSHFKVKKISRQRIARSLGFSTVQSVTNLFCSRHYLNDIQARILCNEYGLNYEYLTSGDGEISSPGKEEFQPIYSDESYPVEHSLQEDLDYVLTRFKDVVNIIGNDKGKEAYSLICEVLKIHRMTTSDIDREAAERWFRVRIIDTLLQMKKEYKSNYAIDDDGQTEFFINESVKNEMSKE